MTDGMLGMAGDNPVGWRQIRLWDNGDGAAALHVRSAATVVRTDGNTTQIPASQQPVPLVAGDPNRGPVTIANAATGNLYALLAKGTVSTTMYTVSIRPGDYYEVPFLFTGLITGVWDVNATGNANVTVLI
jgi:hypothetical protein